MAEAYALSDAVEHGLLTRAIIVDMRGRLDIRQWEEMASAAMGQVWLADCESLFAHLISPNTKQVDNKRLAIDLSAVKQLIWDNRDYCDEDVDGSKGDYLRWIDMSAMLSDCLMKTMTPLSIERNIEFRYLRYETHSGESRHQSQKQEVESIKERAGTFERS